MIIRSKTYDQDFCDKVVELYKEHNSCNRIIEILNVPHYVIYEILKAHGFEINQQKKREEKRSKTCLNCGNFYRDNTKRLVGKTCSKKCANSLMVKKRKSNNSYTRTHEQNLKTKKTINKKFENGELEHAKQISAENGKKLAQKYADPSLKEEMLIKRKQTNFERYGTEFPQRLSVVKEKSKQTNVKKYGTNWPTQSQKTKEKTKETRIQNGLTKIFEGKTMQEWADHLGISYTYFKQITNEKSFEDAKRLSKSQSNIEIHVKDILDNLNIEYQYDKFIPNDTQKLYRPDFYLTDFGLIVECDGLFWHSDAVQKNKNYHKLKKEYYKNLDLNSLFFTADEIEQKPKIIESIIKNKLNLCTRIFARKTTIEKLEKNETDSFFQDCHLMGKGRGEAVFLKFGNDIVAGIQYKWKNKNKRILEISRFCTKLGTTVVGGFSKLLSYVFKEKSPNVVETFIDCRYGSGEYLEKLGFKFEGSHISFSWTDGKQRMHRLRFPGNSGYNHKLNKIWDCGQAKWIYKI